MSNTITEIFLGDETAPQIEDGLIWKPIMRTGNWAVHPSGIGKPLTITKEGDTNYKDGKVSLSDILEAYKDGAMENVTIPLSHENNVLENTGYIRDLKIVDGEDGISRLVAGHDFTEKDVEQKAKNGSIPGNSAGVLFDYKRKSDGKEYPAVLAHSCLTPVPWLDGLGAFGLSATDEIERIETLQPVIEEDELADEVTLPEVEGFFRRLEGHLKDFAESFKPKAQEEVPEVEEPNEEPEEIVEPEEEQVQVVSEVEPSTPGEQLAADQRQRLAHLSQERTINTNGGNDMSDVNKLELSDDAKQLFADQQSRLEKAEKEAKELRASARKGVVKSRIEELKKLGLDQESGLLRTIESIYFADDGGAALLLSQDGNEVSLTASDVADKIVDAMPKNEEGKIILAQQITEDDHDDKPPADTDEELSLEDRSALAREYLGVKA